MERDVYFVATTAEEWGLLGAQAFAEDPPLPLDSIIAAFKKSQSPEKERERGIGEERRRRPEEEELEEVLTVGAPPGGSPE